MNIVLVLLLSCFFVSPLQANLYGFFPKSIGFTKNGKNYDLKLTGATTRKKFFIKIYNVASYLEAEAMQGNLLDEIMNDANAKQLIVKWTHNAPLLRVRNGYLSSFKEALSEKEFLELEGEITKYLSFLKKDVRNGDEHILRWLPGGYIETVINGKIVGSITNSHFARVLWKIWFSGDSSANGGSLLMH